MDKFIAAQIAVIKYSWILIVIIILSVIEVKGKIFSQSHYRNHYR